MRETQRRHVVFFDQSRFIQGLNIVEHVPVYLYPECSACASPARKHERIIGVRRMRELDFPRFGGGF